MVEQARARCANFRQTHTYEFNASLNHFHVGVLAHHVVRHAIDPLPNPRFVCVGHWVPPRSFIIEHPLLLEGYPLDRVASRYIKSSYGPLLVTASPMALLP